MAVAVAAGERSGVDARRALEARPEEPAGGPPSDEPTWGDVLEGISDLATGVGVAFLPVLTIPGLLPAVLLVVVPTIVLMLPLLLVGAVAVLLVRLGALIKRRHA